MAIAKFHSFRGKSSALIMVRANKFVFSSDAVYVPKDSVPADIEKGTEFELPDGFTIIPFIDFETGECRTTEKGEQLHTLMY